MTWSPCWRASSARIEAKARAELEAWHLERRVNVVEMVGVLHDIARLQRDRPDDAQDLALKIDAIFQQAGGLERIISACEDHLGKGAKDWRRFIEPYFRSHRRWLYDLTEALPLAASPGLCIKGSLLGNIVVPL